ncbi:MAG: ECF transporter S component [Lachnospiraceae bacterium]|jgi:uncharacterized membrane protein|nr:ECF transporter S component [Lachnospiraceae bacterium]
MKKNYDLLTLVQLAMLICIQLVMKAIGLGSVPVGPLYMSFLTLPIAVAAIIIGPAGGAITGAVFGLVSFKDALTGGSAMTSALLGVSPVHTFILCVVTRTLMGLLTGVVYSLVKQFDHRRTWSLFVGSIAAPLLNTLLFMGYICLVFYHTDYVQNLVNTFGVSNPLAFVVALVGLQGLIEAVAVGVVGGIVCKSLSAFLSRQPARMAA